MRRPGPWYRRAAEAGDPNSCNSLGNLLSDSGDGGGDQRAKRHSAAAPPSAADMWPCGVARSLSRRDPYILLLRVPMAMG